MPISELSMNHSIFIWFINEVVVTVVDGICISLVEIISLILECYTRAEIGEEELTGAWPLKKVHQAPSSFSCVGSKCPHWH